jgi:acetylornithine aminotransferase
LLGPGSHGSTFGGNPMSCAAALAVLDVIEREGLLANVPVVSDRLRSIVTGSTLVGHVRGRGLLLGVVLRAPVAAEVEAAARHHGLIVNAVAPDVIRMAPPLILTAEDLDWVAERWPLALAGLS